MLTYVALGMKPACNRLEALELVASVGPESGSGWTVVWVDTDDSDLLLDAFDAPLLLVGGDDATGLRLRPDGRGAPLLTWPGATESRELATTAAAMFDRPSSVDTLCTVFDTGDRDRLDLLVDRLTPLLDLPVQPSVATGRSVVLTRGDRDGIRLAAAIAGPTWLVDQESGWTLVQPAIAPEHIDEGGDPLRSQALAAGVSGVRRRDRVLLLWRDGPATGVQVWRGGAVVAEWTWSPHHGLVFPDPLALEAVVTAELGELAVGDAHLPSIRALLRRSRTAGDPLDELVQLLALPANTVALLDDGLEGADGVELVAKSSWVRAVRGAAQAQQRRPVPSRWRPASLVHAAFTACAALVVLAMTGLMVAYEDWTWSAVFALLSAVLVPTAVRRARRLRVGGRAPAERDREAFQPLGG